MQFFLLVALILLQVACFFMDGVPKSHCVLCRDISLLLARLGLGFTAIRLCGQKHIGNIRFILRVVGFLF